MRGLKMTDYEKFEKVFKASGVPYAEEKQDKDKVLIVHRAVDRHRCKRPNAACLDDDFFILEYIFNEKEEFIYFKVKEQKL
jgi:hypothetical protein